MKNSSREPYGRKAQVRFCEDTGEPSPGLLCIKPWMILVALAMVTSPTARGQIPDGEPPGPLSGSVAMAWSLAPPLAVILAGLVSIPLTGRDDTPGIIIISTGLAMGPMFGHGYTNEWGKCALFFLGRGLALGALAGSALPLLVGLNDEEEKSKLAVGIAGTLVGVVGYIGLTIWEFRDVFASVDRRNRSSRPGSVTISPFIPSTPHASWVRMDAPPLGLQVLGTF